jgi:Skp family chaperone for outer membrane proteins
MRLLSIVSAAAIAVAAVAVTSDASAQRNRNNGQATTSVVINYQRVLAESALGRDLQSKLQTIGQQIGAELQGLGPEQQSIEQEAQRLAGTTRNQSAEQLRNNPQVQALAQRQQTLQTRVQTLQGDMECTRILSRLEVNRLVEPVVRSVMQSRGAGIVIDASNVSVSAPEFDITTTVIQQLDANQATRAVNVTRRPVAECQAQGQQAAGQ